jgi:hypothetical protein
LMFKKVRTIGNRMLNASPKLRTYTPVPSTPCFMAVLWCLFSRLDSSLDAFSS